MMFVTPITTLIKAAGLKSQQGRTCKADQTDDRRVNDLSNKETIEHLICITNFFLNDSRPLIWKNTIQKQLCLCTKQLPAGKKINGDQKSKEHVLEHAEHLDQLYCDIINNSLDRLHHAGIGTQDIIQSTLDL